MLQRTVLGVPSEDEMRLLSNLKRWLEVHTAPAMGAPEQSRWRSHNPAVRDLALDRTYERLDEREQEVRETLNRLEAEVQVLTEYRVRPAPQEPTGDDGGSSASG